MTYYIKAALIFVSIYVAASSEPGQRAYLRCIILPQLLRREYRLHWLRDLRQYEELEIQSQVWICGGAA